MLESKYQDYMSGLIKKVIDDIGPRPPCSEAEKKLGRLLVEEWKPICDRVDVEPFTCSPHAFIGSILLSAFFYLVAVISYWFLPPLALALATINCSILFLEIFRYREYIDFLFPRKRGENVVGTIRPKGETAQRVIVSAHMDSQYEFNLFLYLKRASDLVTPIAMVAVFMAFCGSLAKTLAYFNVFSNEAALNGVGIALIALSPSLVSYYFSLRGSLFLVPWTICLESVWLLAWAGPSLKRKGMVIGFPKEPRWCSSGLHQRRHCCAEPSAM